MVSLIPLPCTDIRWMRPSAISAEAVREPAGWISVYGKIPTAESVSAAATVSGAVNGALYAQV